MKINLHSSTSIYLHLSLCLYISVTVWECYILKILYRDKNTDIYPYLSKSCVSLKLKYEKDWRKRLSSKFIPYVKVFEKTRVKSRLIYECMEYKKLRQTFLWFRVFGLWFSTLYWRYFGRYVLWPSSEVCRTREPTWNFESRPLCNPLGPLIPLIIYRY